MSRDGWSSTRVVGDWLLHPVPLLAAGLLALNDLHLKASYPGFVTGKLSDVAGMIFFPLFLVCLLEFVGVICKPTWRAGRRALLVCIVATGAVFAIINVSTAAGAGYERVMQSIWTALGGPSGEIAIVRHVVDPTDLVALAALLVPWHLGTIRLREAYSPVDGVPPDFRTCGRAIAARGVVAGSRRGTSSTGFGATCSR